MDWKHLTKFDASITIRTLLSSILDNRGLCYGVEPRCRRKYQAHPQAAETKPGADGGAVRRLPQHAGTDRAGRGQSIRGDPGKAGVGAEEFLRNDGFEALRLSREVDNRAERLDGGKVLLRPSIPYEEATRLETAFLDVYISGCYRPEPSVSGCVCFLDLYISARYAPEVSVPGCVCHATLLSGTVQILAEEQEFQLLERDALRFAADQPWTLENQGNSTVRALLLWQYRKKES